MLLKWKRVIKVEKHGAFYAYLDACLVSLSSIRVTYGNHDEENEEVMVNVNMIVINMILV